MRVAPKKVLFTALGHTGWRNVQKKSSPHPYIMSTQKHGQTRLTRTFYNRYNALRMAGKKWHEEPLWNRMVHLRKTSRIDTLAFQARFWETLLV